MLPFLWFNRLNCVFRIWIFKSPSEELNIREGIVNNVVKSITETASSYGELQVDILTSNTANHSRTVFITWVVECRYYKLGVV